MPTGYKGLNVLYTSKIPDGSGGFETYAAIITRMIDVKQQIVCLFVMPMVKGSDPGSMVSPRFNQDPNPTQVAFSDEVPGTPGAVGKWGFLITA